MARSARAGLAGERIQEKGEGIRLLVLVEQFVYTFVHLKALFEDCLKKKHFRLSLPKNKLDFRFL